MVGEVSQVKNAVPWMPLFGEVEGINVEGFSL